MRKPIYVVDDQQSICDSVKGIFTDEGHEVITCSDARTLFEKATRLPPALVFLDIWLPDVDGLKVLSEIKHKFPETSVIMMSGHAGINSAVTAIKAGAYDFLEKPLNLEILIEKANRILKIQEGTNSLIHQEVNSAEDAFHRYDGDSAVSLVNSERLQRTLKGNIVLNGTGLMSGRNTGIILSPLDENKGKIFESLSGQRIPAHISSLKNYASDST